METNPSIIICAIAFGLGMPHRVICKPSLYTLSSPAGPSTAAPIIILRVYILHKCISTECPRLGFPHMMGLLPIMEKAFSFYASTWILFSFFSFLETFVTYLTNTIIKRSFGPNSALSVLPYLPYQKILPYLYYIRLIAKRLKPWNIKK